MKWPEGAMEGLEALRWEWGARLAEVRGLGAVLVKEAVFLFFPKFYSLLVFFFKLFNWRVITSQYCGGFAIHQCESATSIPVVPLPPEAPSHLPPHPVRLGCPRAPTLGDLRSLSL